MDEQDELKERLAKLISSLTSELRSELSDDHQQEIAELVKLLPDLTRPGCSDLIGPAEVAAKSLLLVPPNMKMASEIRKDIIIRIRRMGNPLKAVVSGGSPSALVILGLGSLLYFAIPILWAFGRRLIDQPQLFGIDLSMLALVSLSGALGSIVSIMVRINDFSGLKNVDRTILFFTGFFKPVIGTSFALFVFAVLSSGLLPLTIDEGKSRFFFIALSFVSGFSERFAQDIVSRTEKAVRAS